MRKKLIIAVVAVILVVVAAVTALIMFLGRQLQATFTVAGSEQAVEIEPGEFPYGEYKLTVTHDSGETEEVILTEDMIPEDEKVKLYRHGEQQITVVYNGVSCEIRVNVRYKNLEHIKLNDKTVVYTGQPVLMLTEGDLPADVSVRYPYGNSFVNAGDYDVTAILYGDSYETVTLKAHLTIMKADYDMSGVTFDDGVFTYDGKEKTVSVTGNLPEGMTVSYSIGSKITNGAIEAGEYTVNASFGSDNPNYNPIDDKSAKLTIEKASYDMSGISLEGERAVYDKNAHSCALVGELPVGVNLERYTTRKTANSDGSECEGEEIVGNGATEAGTYLITLYFAAADEKNYSPLQPLTAELIIERAEYPLTGVYLNADSVTYDGNYHALKIEGEQSGSEVSLPDDISVNYTVRKINNSDGSKFDGEETEGGGATDAGAYVVTAHFAITENADDYLPLQSLSAVLVIARATIDVSGVYLSGGEFAYDGEEHSISVSGEIPQGVTVEYTVKKIKNADGSDSEGEEIDGNGATDAGTYEVSARFINTDVNYIANTEKLSAYLVINQAQSGGNEE